MTNASEQMRVSRGAVLEILAGRSDKIIPRRLLHSFVRLLADCVRKRSWKVRGEDDIVLNKAECVVDKGESMY
jgi:hypothetical protein